jgi:hypothetical protein
MKSVEEFKGFFNTYFLKRTTKGFACSCVMYLKKGKCKHALALALREGVIQVPADYTRRKLTVHKQKPGRKRKVGSALELDDSVRNKKRSQNQKRNDIQSEDDGHLQVPAAADQPALSQTPASAVLQLTAKLPFSV